MGFGSYLRKLAKSISSQNTFIAAKEINGIKIFENSIDFSKIQSEYLSYLYFYKSLYEDIYSKKVSDKVLTLEIYEDAYSYYRNKHDDSKKDKKSEGKQRKIQATFAKDNSKIKFPDTNKEVK